MCSALSVDHDSDLASSLGMDGGPRADFNRSVSFLLRYGDVEGADCITVDDFIVHTGIAGGISTTVMFPGLILIEFYILNLVKIMSGAQGMS